jgi:peptide/nickel transport system ATP-binding protein
MMAPLVQVEHLVKHFAIAGSAKPLQAVSDVSFSIGHAETLGIVGESGSGKTTVGRCVLRLIEPTSGRLLIDGHDLSSLPRESLRLIRPQMQLVFQEPFDSLDPQMTVWQIVAEPLRLHTRLSKAELHDRVLELLDKVGLPRGIADRHPHQMAAGQQQRAGIARAIATEPRFIVLDEPVSSLDPTARAEIIDLLIDLQERQGITYLFISHDLSTVRYLCNWVAVMYLGKIVEMSRTEELFERPVHPYTRALLSAVPEPDPELRRAKFVLKGEIPSPINLPRGCHLHTRCPAAEAKCCATAPELAQIDQDHWVSCLRARESGFTESLAAYSLRKPAASLGKGPDGAALKELPQPTS